MTKKLYPCKECGRKVQIRSKGMCSTCRVIQLQKERPKVYKKPIKSKPSFGGGRNKEQQKLLKDYFDTQLEKLRSNPYSQESGNPIRYPSKANICHILFKRKQGGFPSIAHDLDNCVFLTLEEHSRFDQLLDQAKFDVLEKEFPKVWNCEKISVLLNKCIERNKFYFKLKEYCDGK